MMTGKQSGTTWIVVANQELMRIYAREKKNGGLEEVKRLENPAGQRAARELVTDRPGRTFDSAGQGRHAMEPPTDPKEQEAIRFAKEIGREIEDGRIHDRFASLILVAGPQFLGRLRQELSDATQKTVEREIGKNLYQFDAAEIRELVANTE
jgi:protein required for attachment to host cells